MGVLGEQQPRTRVSLSNTTCSICSHFSQPNLCRIKIATRASAASHSRPSPLLVPESTLQQAWRSLATLKKELPQGGELNSLSSIESLLQPSRRVDVGGVPGLNHSLRLWVAAPPSKNGLTCLPAGGEPMSLESLLPPSERGKSTAGGEGRGVSPTPSIKKNWQSDFGTPSGMMGALVGVEGRHEVSASARCHWATLQHRAADEFQVGVADHWSSCHTSWGNCLLYSCRGDRRSKAPAHRALTLEAWRGTGVCLGCRQQGKIACPHLTAIVI